jgi:hypothetical protein
MSESIDSITPRVETTDLVSTSDLIGRFVKEAVESREYGTDATEQLVNRMQDVLLDFAGWMQALEQDSQCHYDNKSVYFGMVERDVMYKSLILGRPKTITETVADKRPVWVLKEGEDYSGRPIKVRSVNERVDKSPNYSMSDGSIVLTQQGETFITPSFALKERHSDYRAQWAQHYELPSLFSNDALDDETAKKILAEFIQDIEEIVHRAINPKN